MKKGKKVLVVEYDVTNLTAKQIDNLMLEAVVQGEASDHHPDVPVVGTKVIARKSR
jgi:hypothetical protein